MICPANPALGVCDTPPTPPLKFRPCLRLMIMKSIELVLVISVTEQRYAEYEYNSNTKLGFDS
jgi:hypothetical protein